MECLEKRCNDPRTTFPKKITSKVLKNEEKFRDENGNYFFPNCSFTCKVRRYYLGETQEKRDELDRANKILDGLSVSL